MVTQFPAKKNAGCPKAPRDFPPTKDGTPLPLPQSLYGRTYWRTFGRTYGRTLTPQPKFLGSIGYQICLAMVLRLRASEPAGSTTKLSLQKLKKKSINNHGKSRSVERLSLLSLKSPTRGVSITYCIGLYSIVSFLSQLVIPKSLSLPFFCHFTLLKLVEGKQGIPNLPLRYPSDVQTESLPHRCTKGGE